MKPFKREFRAIDFEHSCRRGGNEKEPAHSPELERCIAGLVKATKEVSYKGIIKSKKNSYQIDLDFDKFWVKSIEEAGWVRNNIQSLEIEGTATKIRPDALISKKNIQIVVEIEKSNKKTIWFDFIKIMMFIGAGKANYGLLVVPKNYAHSKGVWNLFEEASYYRWCLQEYAKADHALLQKIAIIGYTQEVHHTKKWIYYNDSVVNEIKERAKKHFFS